MMVPGESDKKKKAGMIRFVPAIFEGNQVYCVILNSQYTIYLQNIKCIKMSIFSVCEWISCTE